MRQFAKEELTQFNGLEGAPADVAYRGAIYDVSESPMFTDGLHGDEHYAGEDLTEGMSDAPHGDDMLDGYPVVGELKE